MNEEASKKDISYKYIKKMILSVNMKPGNIIDEKKIVSDLGFSRTPVREALMRLAEEGLVSIMPSRAMIIPTISIDRIKMLYQTRSLIEPFIAREASLNHDEKRLEQFREHFTQVVQSSFLDDGSDLDNEFHTYLASCTGNTYLIRLESTLMAQCQIVRLLSSRYTASRAEEARIEHLAIIKALEEGNAKEAEEATRNHLQSSMEGYKKIFYSPEFLIEE